LIKPTGFAGKVPDPAVAVALLLKFTKFRKNCCHARVGLFVIGSKNSDCGYGLICCEEEIPVAINSLLD
jgi:hypothetical protein